ncbi:D-alanyl-D-alanine dipeptidase [Nocardioides sp. BE266]|uniref:M15 family metallopeptidase n=1 Tax=Nocardioides sp. BE266 TaxID=2817725 RepID=UPI00285E3158|nr:M15 family metallopeptidase [Nocardioides sp. BE266]MDR7254793.1 D-alanyl-D-alanine dipeptidase [Nocardioides sp. BE266]
MSLARPFVLASVLLTLGCAATQEPSVARLDRAVRSTAAVLPGVPEGLPRRSGAGDLADGDLPAGATVYDDHPGIARLDPRLLEELRAATADAAAEGVGIVVNSGWRSQAYQQRLFDEAVAEHGSESAAAEWVARPGTSVHEAGAAVDVGPLDATLWLADHGADYGLCRVYDNEPWHFELVADAVDDGCPATYADPADDPRLQ